MTHIPIMQSPKLGVFIVCVPEFNSPMRLLVWFPGDFSPANVWQNLRLIYGIMILSVHVGGIWCMLLSSISCVAFSQKCIFSFLYLNDAKKNANAINNITHTTNQRCTNLFNPLWKLLLYLYVKTWSLCRIMHVMSTGLHVIRWQYRKKN